MMPTFQFTVDDEPFSTEEHTLTPVEILEIAGLDPSTHYVIQIRGNQQFSLKDKLNEPININQNAKFISAFTGETTVSMR